MNRPLQIVNLAGVIILAALCVFQWRQNRILNLDVNELEKVRQTHTQQLGEQEKQVRGLSDDLATFKEQFTGARQELADTKEKLQSSGRVAEELRAERDQLQVNLTNWMNAVTERDDRIKEGNERIGELVERLNASVQRFNELVTNHNDIVTRYNDLAERAAGAAAK